MSRGRGSMGGQNCGPSLACGRRGHRRVAALRVALLASTALVAAALPLSSHATDWTGTTSTDWFDPNNWSAGVPANGVDANIDTVAPNPTVVEAPAQAFFLNVGVLGTGALTIQNGGTVSNLSGTVEIGRASCRDSGEL